jgi:preprotein translocase subunit SecG
MRSRAFSVTGAPYPRCYPAPAMPWLQISAVIQVLLSAFVVVLVLMHSGREAGMGGLGFTPHSQGGTHIVERNLTRLTVVVASVFGVNTIILFHLL